jgi:hypothetical protein
VFKRFCAVERLTRRRSTTTGLTRGYDRISIRDFLPFFLETQNLSSQLVDLSKERDVLFPQDIAFDEQLFR